MKNPVQTTLMTIGALILSTAVTVYVPTAHAADNDGGGSGNGDGGNLAELNLSKKAQGQGLDPIHQLLADYAQGAEVSNDEFLGSWSDGHGFTEYEVGTQGASLGIKSMLPGLFEVSRKFQDNGDLVSSQPFYYVNFGSSGLYREGNVSLTNEIAMQFDVRFRLFTDVDKAGVKHIYLIGTLGNFDSNGTCADTTYGYCEIIYYRKHTP